MWGLLEQIDIIIGISFAAVELAQLFYIYHVNEDVEDLMEDIEEIQDELDDH